LATLSTSLAEPSSRAKLYSSSAYLSPANLGFVGQAYPRLYFLLNSNQSFFQLQVEVRSMGNPPAVVKLALESICLLLGENATDWKAIRQVGIRLKPVLNRYEAKRKILSLKTIQFDQRVLLKVLMKFSTNFGHFA
jgi:hypothetical protein